MADGDCRETLEYLSALVRATIVWADSELAGGVPPKHVAQQLVDSLRYLRVLIRQALS
jgi:hypothetical protein